MESAFIEALLQIVEQKIKFPGEGKLQHFKVKVRLPWGQVFCILKKILISSDKQGLLILLPKMDNLNVLRDCKLAFQPLSQKETLFI